MISKTFEFANNSLKPDCLFGTERKSNFKGTEALMRVFQTVNRELCRTPFGKGHHLSPPL